MSRPAVAAHASSLTSHWSWGGPYVAPTAWSPKLPVAAPTPAAAPPPPGPAAAPPGAPAAPGAGPAAPGHVDPFFRPEDLITQNNFWAQWNQTFAGLDQQLGDLQANTAFNRAQLAQHHTQNVSNINDDAAARGLAHSSIRDGNQAQEQTSFTRGDQNLQDTLNRFAQYVKGQHNMFDTQTLPAFKSAEDQQAVQNAQDVNASYVPPPAQAAPAPYKPTIIGQQQQPITPRPAAPRASAAALHPQHAHAIGQILQHTGRIIGGLR